MNKYLILDIENDSTNKYERKAGNFLYDDIVAIAYKTNTNLRSLYYTSSGFDQIPHISNDTEVLVGHNIKHDLLFLWKVTKVQDFLKRGGKIWCTQLAEYILSSQQYKYPALRNIAVNKYGCKEREKLMEKYWEDNIKILDNETNKILHIFPETTNNYFIAKFIDDNNICNSTIIHGSLQTSEIPKELVIEDVENDVLDTEQVYLQQVELAKELGMFNLIELLNDGLLATIEMEYNGLKVDKDILQSNKIKLEKELEIKKLELHQIINKYWIT